MALDLRPAINRSVLTLYRIFAVISLYAVLAGVLVFAAGAAFYAVNRSWIAPVVLSQADKETLDVTSKLVTTLNTVEDLQIDIARLQKQLDEGQTHRAGLKGLLPVLDEAIQREKRHNESTGKILGQLTEQKQEDNVRTQDELTKLAGVEATVDTELANGLVTKADAIEMKTQFAKSNSDLTDSRISALLLRDNILLKTTSSTTYMEVMYKKAELVSEITQLDITIATSQRQIATEKAQVDRLNAAVKITRETPYSVAITDGKVYLALVPYDNQSAVAVGAPIYNCYFSFIGCRQVGSVKTMFAGEEHAQNPIFHTDLRGELVQLALTDSNAAKSRTLFVGKKPLLF